MTYWICSKRPFALVKSVLLKWWAAISKRRNNWEKALIAKKQTSDPEKVKKTTLFQQS